MKKNITKALLLPILLGFPFSFTQAQTFMGIENEKAAQNTPEEWNTVELPQLPTISASNTFNIIDFGALISATDNTKAIQKALDAVPATGGMVVIPEGTWLFGNKEEMTSSTEVLSIKSKTILHLCAGATLKLADYDIAPNNKTIFIGCKNRRQNDIIIEGEGENSIIDGNGAKWWLAKENKETFNPGSMIRFEQGSRFLIRNLKIQNTPGVNITISNSGKASHATIHDVTIQEPASEIGAGKASHNTDGIAIWGPYVNIYHCDISNGDDNVVCDNYAQYIHIWDCNFGTGHGASIGSYTHNIKHVWFDNIRMNGTTAGIRLKTGRNTDGTLRGGGEEDLKFTNFTMTQVKTPFSIDCYYDKQYNSNPDIDKANARDLDETTPTYTHILLQNIKTTDTCNGYAIFLIGRPESHIKDVILDNVQIKAKKGIDIRFVDNLTFRNGSKITCSSGNLWINHYDSSYTDECNATSENTRIHATTSASPSSSAIYDLGGKMISKSSNKENPAIKKGTIYIKNNHKYIAN